HADVRLRRSQGDRDGLSPLPDDRRAVGGEDRGPPALGWTAMADREALRRKADLLRALHRPGDPVVFVNVWDCASARILEASGAPAVATASAGVAFSLGYADGQQISRDEMLAAVARITASVSVPVTADLEAGYGTEAPELVVTIRGLVDAGGVGLNLEDHVGAREAPLIERSLAIDRVRAVRRAAE